MDNQENNANFKAAAIMLGHWCIVGATSYAAAYAIVALLKWFGLL